VHNAIPALVALGSIQVEELAFSAWHEKSVAECMRAEVGIQAARQNLETGRIHADIAVAAARAKVKAIRLCGETVAGAIRFQDEAGKTPLWRG